MNTYVAGKGRDDDGQGAPDTREWVFGLLATRRYRDRAEQLGKLDLRRRSGCEPCLRALVLDEWTPETLHHLGWCDSCRSATLALGMGVAGAQAWYQKRVLWVTVAAVAVIAAPLAISEAINDHVSAGNRGGVAIQVQPPVVPVVPRSKPPGKTPTVGHERAGTIPARGQRALPLTT